MSHANRRSQARFRHIISARYEAGQASGTGYLWDVSESGLCLRVDTLPKKGDSVRIIILADTPMTVHGEVRWIEDKGPQGVRRFGVLLSDVSDEFRTFYGEVVESGEPAAAS